MTSPHPVPGELAALAADLRVARTRALRGASVWNRAPVVLSEVELGGLASRTVHDAPEFIERLESALPALAHHRERPISDTTRVHAAGGWWCELLVLVTLELQRQAGAPPALGRLVLSDPADDRWTVAIGYDEEALGVEAVRLGARIMRDLLRGNDPEIAESLDSLRRRYEQARPARSTRAIIDAAARRGIAVRRRAEDETIQLGLGVTQRRLAGTTTDRTSVIAADAVRDQRLVRRLLDAVGVPVPRSDRARSLADALEIAEELGYPVRITPTAGAAAESDPLPDAEAVRRAWPLTASRDEGVIERIPMGRRLRVLVAGGRVASVEDADPAVSAPVVLHPQNAAVCELAAGAIGLDIAMVEVTTPDASVPFRCNGALVTGLHASPEVPADPASERAAADAIVDALYPDGAATTIPVIAITGTNGKTTTTRLIAHLFRLTGRTVGFTTTDGVYLQEQLLVQGDLTGPFAANVVLSHPETEVAVLETARGGILKSGLGWDACDVAVVMNVTADHLGLRGIDTVEQLAEVKAVIPGAVKTGGYAVLNADDALVYAMRARTAGTIALFSTRAAGENAAVEEHLATGGILARPELVDGRERLVIRQGGRRADLGAVADIPLTFGGLARFQVENVLAASTAAWVQGVSDELIAAGLQTFVPSSAVTPGRLNIVETTRGRVLLDYAHNAAAITGLLDFVRAMPARRRMALLSAPGDRRDEDLREIGRLAEGLDLAIMKEHPVYRRGRAPGEIARIMADGLRATGTAESRIVTFTEEPDAVAHVMTVMQPGDVVIIIADDTSAVMRQLDPILAGVA